ncbi:MAG: hypothetical protein LLG04_06655 [Parachlamydia sp.]|nr:hypothetical protein [Parachlamydia sp.]
MRIILLLFTLSLFPSHLPSLEYGFFSKRQGNPPKRLAILAERCSGSNYVEGLILSNFENLDPDYTIHKHFPPWIWKARKTDSTLFVVIFRNPYDWLRSLHRIPHHADRSLWNIPFSQFIRSQWVLTVHDPITMKLGNPLVDRNPHTGQPFKNVMKLRTEKIKTMLRIRKSVKNIYCVQYETARDYPKEVLQEIQKLYSLKATPIYHPVVHYQANAQSRIYEPRKYAAISGEDLAHINAHLDKRIERKIGYRLIFDPANIP